MKRLEKNRTVTGLFLLSELILYSMILTRGGTVLRMCSFGAIVLCFLYTLLHIKQGSRLLIGGLACTVMADFCLVMCVPIQQLWGMVFFLGTQTLYAVELQLRGGNRVRLLIRGLLILGIEAVAAVILKEKLDALAVVSVCYYANLVMNIVEAFVQFRKDRLLAMGLVLFLCCDTVIGLQVASGGYLPIGEGTLLHKLLFMNFNLSWFFYLPSQVLISLCAGRKQR